MLEALKRFYAAAKDKLTTYVGLAVTGTAVLTEKSEDLLNSLPQLSPYLPSGPHVHTALHWITMGLGVLVVFARVRRLLGTPK